MTDRPTETPAGAAAAQDFSTLELWGLFLFMTLAGLVGLALLLN